MNKFDSYLGLSTELENLSKYTINYKPEDDQEDIDTNRQLINFFVIFIAIFLVVIIILNEYTYDYVTIRRAGINSRSLCENIPDNFFY